MGLLGTVLAPVGDAVADVAELVGITPASSTAASTTKHSPAPAPSSSGTTTLSSTKPHTTSTSAVPEGPPSSSASASSASAPVTSSSLIETSSTVADHSSSPLIHLADPSGVATATSTAVAIVSGYPSNPPPPPDPPILPPSYPPAGDPSGNGDGQGGGQGGRRPPRSRSLTAGQAAAVGIVTAIVVLLAIMCGYRLYSIRRRRAKRDRMAARPTTWMSQHGPPVRDSGWNFTESSRSSLPVASPAHLDRAQYGSAVEPVHRLVIPLDDSSSFETDVVTSPTVASTPHMKSIAFRSEAESNEIGADAIKSALTWELALREPQRTISHMSSPMDFITRITHPEDHAGSADAAARRAAAASPQYSLTQDPFASPPLGTVLQPHYGLPAFSDFRFPSQRLA